MASPRTDPYVSAWRRVADAIVSTPGSLPEATRRGIVAGDDPAGLAQLLDQVRRHAYRIVDEDLAGLDEDTALEAILAAALGAADERRRAALEALR